MKVRWCAALLPALFSLCVRAQTSPNTAFAITSDQSGGQNWTEIKEVDLNTGNVTADIFNSNKGVCDIYDGRTGKPITLKTGDSSAADDKPFSGLSAACAYDEKSNRLFFAPLFINQLRYIDLGAKVPSVYIFKNETLGDARDVDVEANQITRMVVAADGNGYALSNDGAHLIRFTTGKIPVVTDLGPLTDAAENDSVSVSDPNTSWGGDMVSDASGNLYLVTAHNLVFRVNVQTHIAAFVSKITGVSPGFTTNGAVVDASGALVLSSANSISGYYKVNPGNWSAKIIPSDAAVYNTSDLANQNFLFKTPLAPVKQETAEEISVFPNPVRSNAFRVEFANKRPGDYNVQVVDVAGRPISDKVVNVLNSGQVSEVKISPSMTRGIYFVKVLGTDSKEIYLKKLIVE